MIIERKKVLGEKERITIFYRMHYIEKEKKVKHSYK
jgi:hypothetical protein